MQAHEAADIFPLDEANIESLAADIRENGQHIPIEVFEGKILDGRRFRACEIAGVAPRIRQVNPADPIAYVISLNRHRRHLDTSQRSMVGARAKGLYDQRAKERQREATIKGNKTRHDKDSPVVANSPPLVVKKAREECGDAVNVGAKSIDYAAKVLDKGTPELVKAVAARPIPAVNGRDVPAGRPRGRGSRRAARPAPTRPACRSR